MATVQTDRRRAPGSNVDSDSLDDAVCNVCFIGVSRAGDEILFCDTCDIAVHQSCYGVDSVPSGDWFCAPCASGRKSDDVKCDACEFHGGALLPVGGRARGRNGKWVHPACVVWLPELDYEDPETLNPITGLDSISKDRKSLRCGICRQKGGACIQCDIRTCTEAYHPMCMLANGSTHHAIRVNQKDELQLLSYCSTHAKLGRKNLELEASAPRSAGGGRRKSNKCGITLRLRRTKKSPACYVDRAMMEELMQNSKKRTETLKERARAKKHREEQASHKAGQPKHHVAKHGAATAVGVPPPPFAPVPDPRVLVLLMTPVSSPLQPTVTEQALRGLWGDVVDEEYFREFDDVHLAALQHPAVVQPGWNPRHFGPEMDLPPELLSEPGARIGTGDTERDGLHSRSSAGSASNVADSGSHGTRNVLFQHDELRLVASFDALEQPSGGTSLSLLQLHDNPAHLVSSPSSARAAPVDLSADTDSLMLETVAEQSRYFMRSQQNNKLLGRLRKAIIASGEAPFVGLFDEHAGCRSAAVCTAESSATVRDDAFDLTKTEALESALRLTMSWRCVTDSCNRGIQDHSSTRRSQVAALPASWAIPVAGRPTAESLAAQNDNLIDDDAVCLVCFDGETSATNEILYCDGCNVGVHQACYGVSEIPDGDWFCDRCRYVREGGTRCHVRCCLCSVVDGALRPTLDGRWVHVFCAIWTPGVWIGSVPNMSAIDVRATATAMALRDSVATAHHIEDMLKHCKLGSVRAPSFAAKPLVPIPAVVPVKAQIVDSSGDRSVPAVLVNADAASRAPDPPNAANGSVPKDSSALVGGHSRDSSASDEVKEREAVAQLSLVQRSSGAFHPGYLLDGQLPPTPINDGVDELLAGSTCVICKQDVGRTIKCCKRGCDQSVHAMCHWYDGGYITATATKEHKFVYCGGGRGVAFKLFCGAHIPHRAIIEGRSRIAQRELRDRYRVKDDVNVESAKEKRRLRKENEAKAKKAEKQRRKRIAAGEKFYLTEPDRYSDGICAVCFDTATASSLSAAGHSEIAVCRSCGITVHKACYGTSIGPKEVSFTCDPCSSSTIPSSVKCELCPRSGGAFKKKDRNKWVHVFCALYTPGVRFERPTKMEGISLQRVNKQRFDKLKCYLCEGGAGACVQCASKDCYRPMHALCAQKAKHYIDMVEQADTGEVLRRVFCSDHVPPGIRFDKTEQKYVRITLEETLPAPERKMRQLRRHFERLRMVLDRVIRREKLKKRQLMILEAEFVAHRKVVGDQTWVDYDVAETDGPRRNARRKGRLGGAAPAVPKAASFLLQKQKEAEASKKLEAAREAQQKRDAAIQARELEIARRSIPLPDFKISKRARDFGVTLKKILPQMIESRLAYPSVRPSRLVKDRAELDLQLHNVLTAIYEATVPAEADASQDGAPASGRPAATRRLAEAFRYPVDPVAHPLYHDIVDLPISLYDIDRRVQWQQYRSFRDFEADLRLLVANAKLYNEGGSDVWNDAVALELLVDAQAAEAAKQDATKAARSQRRMPKKRRRSPVEVDAGDDGEEAAVLSAGRAQLLLCRRCKKEFHVPLAKPGDESMPPPSDAAIVYAVPQSEQEEAGGLCRLWVCRTCLREPAGAKLVVGTRVLVWSAAWDEWNAGVLDTFAAASLVHRLVLDDGTWDFVDLSTACTTTADTFKTRRLRTRLGM